MSVYRYYMVPLGLAIYSASLGQQTSPSGVDVAVPAAARSGSASPAQPEISVIYDHLPTTAAPQPGLYRDVEDANHHILTELLVGSSAVIQVRFRHINTFYFAYVSEKTRDISFYGGSMPSVLSPLFGNRVLGSVPPARGVADDFKKLHDVFAHDYDSLRPLSDFLRDVDNVFTTQITAEKENPEIKSDVLKALVKVFHPNPDPQAPVPQDPKPEDLDFRHDELKDGIRTLAADIVAMRKYESEHPDETEVAQIKEADEFTTALNDRISDYEAAKALFQKVVDAPKEVVSAPIVITGDQAYISVEAVPISPGSDFAAAPKANPEQWKHTIVITVTGRSGFDFSAGIVATHPTSHSYYLVHGSPNTVAQGTSADPAFSPSVFLHYYRRPMPGHFSLGPTFGASITGNQYFMGLSLVRGGAQRVMLVGGLALNQVSVLNGDTVGGVAGSGQVQTRQRYAAGWFLGLTFNFGM
jgi:hypothetical protein